MSTLSDFKKGDRVTHQLRGGGEVVYAGAMLHVLFDDARDKGPRASLAIYDAHWFDTCGDMLALAVTP